MLMENTVSGGMAGLGFQQYEGPMTYQRLRGGAILGDSFGP